MASIHSGNHPNGLEEQRIQSMLAAIFGVLSVANLGMMITEPTVWQGVFSVILLVVGLSLWLNASARAT